MDGEDITSERPDPALSDRRARHRAEALRRAAMRPYAGPAHDDRAEAELAEAEYAGAEYTAPETPHAPPGDYARAVFDEAEEHDYAGRHGNVHRADVPLPDGRVVPGSMHSGETIVTAPPARPAKTRRWLIIIGIVLILVLGALYGFNALKQHMIASYFANNKPPPSLISAATAVTAEVPRSAPGIGSLVAVHQVTVTPEIGGRITKISFEAGATVKAGDPLVQLNDGPEQGDLANYRAQAKLAGISLGRARELAQRQFGPQATVDQTQSQLDQANGLIKKTEAQIDQKSIRAPFAGKLGTRQVDLGQYISPGAPIVTLTDLSTLFVNFSLPSQMRPQLVVGQAVTVTNDAYPGRNFTAQLTAIEPQVSADTRTLQVQATMSNPDGALFPGMFVNASIVLPPQANVVTLPATAVDYTLYGDSVFLIQQDGQDDKGNPILKATRTPVTTGSKWDDKVAILEGVKAGDRVVAAGQVKVQNGSQVKISDSPAPQQPANPTLN